MIKKLILCCTFLLSLTYLTYASSDTVVVLSFAGDVKIIPSGGTDPVFCNPGMILKEGTRIVTGEESYLEMAFDRSSRNIVKVKENSEVVIKLDGIDKISLIDGEMYTLLRELKKGETFRVRTPSAICGARGTGWSLLVHKNVTEIISFDGRVFVRGVNSDGSGAEEEVWIKEGYSRKIRKFERPGKMEKVSESKLSSLRKELGLKKNIQGHDRLKVINKIQQMREKHTEQLLEKKNESKIGQIRDD